jgi:biotin-dependent carboxylase-like uncharacterized protein
MSAGLRIMRAGPGATLQDAGRFGYLRFGVTPAGPMDWAAFRLANLLAGNPEGAAAIELSIGGIEVEAEGRPIGIAFAGAAYAIQRNGAALPPAGRVTLKPGDRLNVRPGEAGMWLYLAIAGRIALPPTMGSLSTHTRSAIGGLEGRSLEAGDRLPVERPRPLEDAAADAGFLAPTPEPLRVVLGPQDDYFSEAGIATFLGETFSISTQMDRMAYRMEGPAVEHNEKGYNIVSDGITFGSVQIPGEKRPFVLMADRQPTGGFPKIATIIRADVRRFAQMRPGAKVRFAAVTAQEGAGELRRLSERIAETAREARPLVRSELPSEFLLGLNLVGGVENAASPSG